MSRQNCTTCNYTCEILLCVQCPCSSSCNAVTLMCSCITITVHNNNYQCLGISLPPHIEFDKILLAVWSHNVVELLPRMPALLAHHLIISPFVSVNQFTCLSFCLSLCLSVCLSNTSVCLSLSVCLVVSVCLPLCLSVAFSLAFCLSLYLSIASVCICCQSLSVSFASWCPPVCLFLCLFITSF